MLPLWACCVTAGTAGALAFLAIPFVSVGATLRVYTRVRAFEVWVSLRAVTNSFPAALTFWCSCDVVA